jgi:hypothetical protein
MSLNPFADPIAALPGERVPEYRYAVHDLATRAQLTEHMPFTIGNYGRALTEAGTTAADLNVGDARNQKFQPWERTQPRRTTLVILRDEVVVGEWIIWQRPPYKPTEKRLHVGASEIRSYFDHRLLRPVAGIGSAKTLPFTQVDQFAIFRALVADCQAVTYQGLAVGDIGVEMDTTQLSGVLRDRRDVADDAGAYHGYTFDSYGQLLDNLATLDNGFEWRIDSYLDPTRTLRRALRLGYPYLGHPPNDDAVTLEYPGTIDDYEWPEDGTTSANYVAAIGAGEEAAMKWGEGYAALELASGFPLLERTTSYKSATLQATLTAHATADVAALSGDVVVPSLTVRGRPDISPGDHVKVRITDEARFAGSSARPFETFMRAVQITTQPGPPEITTIAVEAPRTPGENT